MIKELIDYADKEDVHAKRIGLDISRSDLLNNFNHVIYLFFQTF